MGLPAGRPGRVGLIYLGKRKKSRVKSTAAQKVPGAVAPAKAGVQNFSAFLDSGFRRNDRKARLLVFCDAVKTTAPCISDLLLLLAEPS
jgi:hypothetical protein